VVSSVLAAVVSRAVFGNHPAFPIPIEYGYTLTREVVLFYPLLGAVTGLMSALFIWCFFHAEEWAARLPLPRAALPWIGGALVGALVYLSRASWWDTGTWRSISRCSGRSRGTCCCCSPWARSWRPRSR
jgi:CIC family chloride channel protein